MKNSFLVMLIALAMLVSVGRAGAAEKPYVLKIIKKGEVQEIDPSAFPKEMRDAYKVLTEHCLECHGQDRIIEVLRTGKSRTGTVYGEKNFHEKVLHMMRQGGVGMSRDDARMLTEFFTFLTAKVKIN
jgi:hypothetical protein